MNADKLCDGPGLKNDTEILQNPTDKQSLAILNVLITILGHHFGQNDFQNDE